MRIYIIVNTENILIAKSINKMIRTYNTTKEEEQYYKRKFREQSNLVDIELRNYFQLEQIKLSVLKRMFGFNHYGTRDKNINKGLCDSDCLRCSNEEDWGHIA